MRDAVRELHRLLAPGGVLLLTVDGVGQRRTGGPEDLWRFTSLSVRRLLEERFPAAAVSVEAYGNLASATAMLHGRAAEEVRPEALVLRDPDYEVLIAARARKAT